MWLDWSDWVRAEGSESRNRAGEVGRPIMEGFSGQGQDFGLTLGDMGASGDSEQRVGGLTYMLLGSLRLLW